MLSQNQFILTYAFTKATYAGQNSKYGIQKLINLTIMMTMTRGYGFRVEKGLGFHD
jgi:hypothetical protein